MLRKFLQYFPPDRPVNYRNSGNFYQDYFDNLGGLQFGGCLFTAFRIEDVPKWKSYIVEAYPVLNGKILPFGYTWDGLCYCVDIRDGKVIICDIGAGDYVVLPCSMRVFLNEQFPDLKNEMTEGAGYNSWVARHGMLKYGTCAGLIRPVFMGGEEEDSNREISDMEVYWSVFTQIKNQVKDK